MSFLIKHFFGEIEEASKLVLCAVAVFGYLAYCAGFITAIFIFDAKDWWVFGVASLIGLVLVIGALRKWIRGEEKQKPSNSSRAMEDIEK
jgi:membrane protein implicated in regulation of membrane protease activity